jgi:hypothetical protein
LTDPASCCPPGEHDRAIAAFQRHAFAALLGGEAPRIADVAEAANRDAPGVSQAIAWLQEHGRLELDGDLLVGAHGLTHRPTAHSLTIGEQRLHTWCAYDAVAIPVPLGATARAATTCPTCGRELVVDINDGPPTRRPGAGPVDAPWPVHERHGGLLRPRQPVLRPGAPRYLAPRRR